MSPLTTPRRKRWAWLTAPWSPAPTVRGSHVLAPHARDAAATAAVLGFFGSAWFGWAQDSPPQAWRWALAAGSILSLVVCAAGTLLTWRRWSEPTALDAQTSRVFGVVVGIEFALAGLGAGVFAAVGRADVIAAWVAVVVGVHLFPLAVLFKYRLLHLTAALVTIAGLAAVPVARFVRRRQCGSGSRLRSGASRNRCDLFAHCPQGQPQLIRTQAFAMSGEAILFATSAQGRGPGTKLRG